MRDYLSPAKRYVSRVIAHPGSLGTVVIKRKSLSFAIAASFVVITTIGFATVKGLMQDSTIDQDAVNKSSDSIVDAQLTTDNLPVPSVPSSEPTDQNTTTASAGSTDNSTNVTVNNQPVAVPDNGSVHKVVQSSNGTTVIDISNSSTTNGSSNSSTSTNINLNTNTNMQSSVSRSD